MKQAVNPNRARNTIFLVSLLLASAMPLVAPPGAASNASCLVQIDHITATPLYADPGSNVTIQVFLRDANPLPDENTHNLVKVSVEARYQNDEVALAKSEITGEIGSEFKKTFHIPADAGAEKNGLGKVNVAIVAPNPPPQELADWCTVGSQETVTWGFWLGTKPDLVVDGDTVKLFEHFEGDEAPGQNQHATEPTAEERFIRYPSQGGGGGLTPCVDELPGNYSRVHFEFTVRNIGAADFTPGGGQSLPLTVRLRDGNALLTTQTVPLNIPAGGSAVVKLTSYNYTLVGHPGLRNISIEADSARVYAEQDETNNVASTPADKTAPGAVYFKAPDLVAGLANVRRDADGKAAGTVNMTNLGDYRGGKQTGNANNICLSRTGGDIALKVYLDVVDPANVIFAANFSLDAAGSPGDHTADADFTSPGRVGAGFHRVIAVADARVNATVDQVISEPDELNNVAEGNFTIEDLLPPALSGITVPATGRSGQAFNITGFVTDDANFTLPGNNIALDFTYPSGANHTFFVPKQTLSNATGTYSGFNVTDTVDKYVWQFRSSYPEEGDYTLRIHANDTVHDVLAGPFGFTLTDFSKAMEVVSVEVCREDSNITGINEASCGRYNETGVPNQPANLSFLPESTQYNQVVRVRFKVPPGATGLDEEYRNATRKTVEFRDRDGRVLGNFTPIAVCFNNLTQAYQSGNACNGASLNCEGLNLTCWVNTFQVVVGHGHMLNSTVSTPVAPVCQGVEQALSTDLTVPAQWNMTFWIGDAGCKFRAHTPDVQPKPAKFRFGLWDMVPAVLNKTAPANAVTIGARDPLVFRTDAFDNLTVLRTFVRVLRGGQEVMFEDLLPTNNVNMTPGSTRNGTYQRSFSTGLYTPLDQDGEYQFLLGALDANNTISWNSANDTTCTPDYAPPNPGNSCLPVARTLRLQDRVRPSVAQDEARLVDGITGAVDNAGRDAFELGQTLVLQAEVDDDTRINVTAEVQDEAGVRVRDLALEHVGPATSKVYRSANVTTGPGGLAEGAYRFIIHVRDSAGNPADSVAHALRVAGNLPPTFSQRTPADGGFGPANGTVGVDVSDAQGVLTSSVAVRFGVNGGTADTPVSNPVVVVRERSPTDVPLVVRVSFQLPASVRHGDRVTVSVQAGDGSVPSQNGTSTWTFTVDALAPRSTLSCTQSHPASCGSEGPQSVRGDTLFTLSAEDVDPQGQARSGVASLRYAVDVAGTPGALQVVPGNSTTFRLGTFAPGDGFYTLRFRAVDNAGNEEPERRLVFALDTQGPLIQNVVVTPTAAGWTLTATVSDAASDVERARVFFRAGATAFEEVPMAKLPDTTFWSANVPGARRGQQVCYYVEAVDFLGNIASNGTSAAPVCFASENHPPSLTVTSPAEGASVVGSLSVVWQVADLDNDPVAVTVAYRRSGEVQFTPVPVSTEEQGQRRKVVDTSGFVAGSYAVRVEAVDNQPFNNRTTRVVNVTLGSDGAGATCQTPCLDRTTAGLGDPVKVRIELARAAASVQAVLLRGGEVVQTQEMEQNPPGSRFWEAEFRIAEPGTYQVEVRGEYENGEPFVIPAANNITVSGGLGPVDLVAGAGLALAVVALAGLGLRRRGWL